MAAIEQVDYTTPLVKLKDDNSGLAEPLVYPYYLNDLLADNTNLSLGSFIYTKNLLDFHLAPVIVDDRPEGDVVEVGEITLEEDGYHQHWTTRKYTEEELNALFETERANRFDQVQALEDNLRLATRTYTYREIAGTEQSFTTDFETDTIYKWLARRAFLQNVADDESVYLYPALNVQVITTAKEALRVVNQYFVEYGQLLDKLNLHRYNLNKATRATGLPSYPDWIA